MIAPSARPPQAIYFPAVTWDYYLKNDAEYGVGLVARRNIQKGGLIFNDSIEFMFADVVEGDYFLLQGHHKASKLSGTKVPATIPVTREMLLRTHGVPAITREDPTGKTAGVLSWRLEVPGCLMNHSCSPTVDDDSHDACKGEGYASRDIKKGEELTYNYLLQYYDSGPFFEKCLCNASTCRGSMMGFKALSDADKEILIPKASAAVQAMHRADAGKEPPPKEELIVVHHRLHVSSDTKRLVFPGPSHALAIVDMKQDDKGNYALYASKDCAFGERVYEFWRGDWPFGGSVPIHMVSSSKLSDQDLREGTVIPFAPAECAAKKSRSGHYQFSGFDLLLEHSCSPNLTYNDLHEYEDDNWQNAYAVRAIKAGEKLTIDFNSVFWDRSDSQAADECNCGAANCVGTRKGFKVCCSVWHISFRAWTEITLARFTKRCEITAL